MNPSLASIICACGIAGLFYLDRDDSADTSKALWLPVAWIWIVGSRPVSAWLGVAPTSGNVQLEGSPVDAAVLGVLLAVAVGVLIRRRSPTRAFLSANWPILIYFLYCLVSIFWADFPSVAFKKWIKAIGDLAMILLVVTDAQPVAALRRLFTRTGFLLLPASVLYIKYYDTGRGYTPDGAVMNTGVTTNKNILGVMLLVISLGTVWRLLSLLRAKSHPHRGRHLLAQGVLLAFGIALLKMADSATSLACFVLGTALILATELPSIRRSPGRVHILVAMIVLIGGLAMLFGQSTVTNALGRQSNMSGRTDIWAAVIPAVPNPVVGAGFESFWIGPNAQKVWSSLVGWYHPEWINEAHNGYIEVYLNLGWVGVGLISFILISGYRRAVAAFRLNPSIGSLMLAYITAAAVYSITEAGFRMLDLMWIFLLLAVVSAGGMAAGLFGGEEPKIIDSRGDTASRMPAGNKLIPTRKTVYANRRGFTQFEIPRADNLR
jgi:exopolysaccharide production protein ExoQ